ncbi:MAG: DUF4367 domain-containing protein [Lachnospiraceae bacterium]|nr:DUF4367 domain-containing protein [Lachnospiraceae bacterium]
MTEMNNSSDDEILYKLLSEKLHRHYCGDEGSQLSDQEIEAVLNVMETIKFPHDSYFNADAAWARFQERYMSEDDTEFSEELLPGDGVRGLADLIGIMEGDVSIGVGPHKKRRGANAPFRIRTMLKSRAVRWTALTVSAVGVMFAGLNIGTYATAKMGFFEFISKNGSSWEFFITGEREEDAGNEGFEIGNMAKNQYQSWEELRKVKGENLLIPEYIPEGIELSSLVISNSEDQDIIEARYGERDRCDFMIVARQYVTEDRIHNLYFVEEDCVDRILPSGRKVYYNQQEDETTVWFLEREYSYCVDGKITLDEIIMIIENMR